MPSYRTTRRVHHTPDHMFALVADVERYPEFVPLCQNLVIRRRQSEDDGRETIVADMRVGYKAVRETFTSQIVLDHANRVIEVEYLQGPFRELRIHWTFTPESGSSGTEECLIGFSISYEFRNRMLGLLMGSMFDSAFRRFAEAFEQRANIVYRGAA